MLVIQTIFFLIKEKWKGSGFLTEPLLGPQGNVHPILDISWNHHQENFEILAFKDNFTLCKKPKQESL